jgi:(2Fe-2S) ferredoxin
MLYSDDHAPLGFNFEGQFLGFVYDDGKLKSMRLRVLSEDMQIKIPKHLRMPLGTLLQPGSTIQVQGTGKLDRQTHTLKLKATQVTPLSTTRSVAAPAAPPVPTPPPAPIAACPHKSTHNSAHKSAHNSQVKVLVCQKSGCLKKGGKGLCEALDQTLCDRNLNQQVRIERTGCLKRCSGAPSLMIMPGNQRYSGVRPKMLPQIADAIAQHLTRC